MNHLSGHSPAFCAGNIACPALRGRLTGGSIEFTGRLCMMVIMLVISSHVQATHDPATGNYAHADYYFQTYADTKTACLASLSGWPTATCGAGTGFAKCVGKVGDGFLNTKTGDQFLHCTAVCPAHSHGTPPSCVCDAGYVFNGTSCILACPLHASGTPCACDAGYVFDATGTCIQQYTLSLSGLGLGVKVMPNDKLETAYAEVKKSNGSAGSGVQVNLQLSVVPEDDGYNHAVGQHTAPHDGSLAPVSGATDSNGKLPFVFSAPVAGGVHTITATCANCVNSPKTGTITVPGCPESDLTKIEDLSNIWDTTDELKQLTQQLEDKMDGYSLLTRETQVAEQCLASRINTVVGPPSISGYKVTSTIRTLAYQKHFVELWGKFLELQKKVDKDSTLQQRCQTLIAKVEGEMGFRLTQDPTDEDERCSDALGRAHCLRYPPAIFDPKHVGRTAFDISTNSVIGFATILWFKKTYINNTVSTASKEANACNLKWGGLFNDPIHFACCVR